MYIAVIYRPGPAWIQGKPLWDQPLQEHFDYMQRLFDEGHVWLGGPFTDTEGEARALAVLKVDHWEQAVSLVASDPAVVSDVAVAELHPWKLLLTGG